MQFTIMSRSVLLKNPLIKLLVDRKLRERQT